MPSIYDYSIKKQNGTNQQLSDFKGKVLLIVNTATKCGFTQQYEGLEDLYEQFSADGFEILDFPCNQFKEQAPGSDQEINEFCQLNYGTSFSRFAKIDVNGPNASSLYQWLRKEKPQDEGKNAEDFASKIRSLSENTEDNAILWNFTKFLVDAEGNVLHRYSPTVTPDEIKKDILQLI